MPNEGKSFQVHPGEFDRLPLGGASCYLDAIEIAERLIKSGYFEECIICEVTSVTVAKVTGLYDKVTSKVHNSVKIEKF